MFGHCLGDVRYWFLRLPPLNERRVCFVYNGIIDNYFRLCPGIIFLPKVREIIINNSPGLNAHRWYSFSLSGWINLMLIAHQQGMHALNLTAMCNDAIMRANFSHLSFIRIIQFNWIVLHIISGFWSIQRGICSPIEKQLVVSTEPVILSLTSAVVTIQCYLFQSPFFPSSICTAVSLGHRLRPLMLLGKFNFFVFICNQFLCICTVLHSKKDKKNFRHSTNDPALSVVNI